MRLIATLTPDDAGSEVTGGICFGPAGDGLEVSGQLNGLDPNKRYQLRVIMSERAVPEATNIRPDDSINKENPLPPRPAGEDRNLGILLSDASGGIVINVALNGVSLAKGDQIVLGKTLTLTEIPAEGASGAPVRIATATVKMPESEKAPTQPSRLDDLGPGERWF